MVDAILDDVKELLLNEQGDAKILERIKRAAENDEVISVYERDYVNDLVEKYLRPKYEPEQFPGLIHRMLDPKTVILLFASGKLVCTGAKKEADVYRSVHNLHSLLEEKKLMIYDE